MRNDKDREAEWVIHCGMMQKGRNDDGEEWADVGGLLATWSHGEDSEEQSDGASLLTTQGHGDVQARLLPRAMSESPVYRSQGQC